MSTTEQQLKRIQEKLQQMLKQQLALQKENQRLKEELSTVNQHFSSQKAQVEELQQQISILRANAGEMNETDKKEFEKKINGFLKEIDRCIALLGD